jgi:hypothetical protein
LGEQEKATASGGVPCLGFAEAVTERGAVTLTVPVLEAVTPAPSVTVTFQVKVPPLR